MSGEHPARGAPPRLAVRLLQHALRGPEGEALLGDLLEAHHERCRSASGRRDAARWFWRQSIAALLAAWAMRPARVAPTRSGERGMHAFLADLRHALRRLRRAPLFTAVCVLTLALGIGATMTIFAVVDPLLLRPIPYPDPGRLALVWERDESGGHMNVGFATYSDLAGQARTLERTAAVGGWEPTVAEGGEPERLVGQRVSWGFFRTLGVRPALGRDFVEAEDAAGANRVVILGHGLWQRRFGGDSAVIGGTLRLDGVAHTIVGVLPGDFDSVLNPEAQIWRVLGYDATQSWACRTCRHLRMVARVRADVTPAAAAAELAALKRALVREHPRDYPADGLAFVPVRQEIVRDVRPVLLALGGAVSLLLLMAVANVANLQLARALRREPEFAIRAALGAGRARLAGQLLAEGLLLALLGGAAGIALAWVALPALVAQLPDTLPRLSAVRLDGRAHALAALLVLLLAPVVGLLPAWRGGRGAAFAALRDGARLTSTGPRLARAGIVTMEVALALMLLVGAGLLGRTLATLLAVDPGFDAARLLTMQVQASGEGYESDEAVFAHHARLREIVRALPGVAGVAHASQLPLAGHQDSYGIRAQDRPRNNPALAPDSDRYVVSTDFLRVMGIPLLEGRPFTPADDDSAAAPVVILSAALAGALWPGERAIGKRVQVGALDSPWREVIGVAGDVRHGGLDASVTQQVYVPERQWPWADAVVTLVVRTHGDAGALAPTVRRVVSALDSTQPVTAVATMDQVLATSTAQRRLALLLFVTFAGTALLMAAAGIYGVLAGSVAERTREIGLRSALGATPRAILALVLAQAARLVVVGVVLGLGGALVLSRYLATLLYGVRPTDPLTLAAVVAALGLVALAACLLPVQRALRVDPMAALRAE